MATTTETNNTPLALPDRVAPALNSLVSQTVTITGATGDLTDVSLTLNLSHTFPADLDILLVAPDGAHNLLVMSDRGGGGDINNTALVLSDSGAVSVPTANITAGTYKPSNDTTTEGAAAFGLGALALTMPNSGADASGGATFASAFAGVDPNGVWTLYLTDDAGADIGTLHSWSLSVTTADLPPADEEKEEEVVVNTVSTSGDDQMNGSGQSENLSAGEGGDRVNAGGGDDSVSGGTGDDSIQGGGDNDTIDGGADNDWLEGGIGGDSLFGGAGSDSLFGGSGADQFGFGPGSGSDWIADFNPEDGDRIVLPKGVDYTLTSHNGQVVILLANGDYIGLVGFKGAFNTDWIVAI